ncbi:phasin family protein [Micromonospora echinaurantiaca]|uniref:phasin family protein n=1 Tax=Micromonospora echinaurantiaca TaxID=47857 RepID=UPI003716A88E
MQDAWRAYLELAMGLTEAPRKKAQDAVRRLVGSGGATAAQLQGLAEELLSTGAANREALTKLVRFEVDRALGAVGLATADEVAELTRRVHELERQLREAKGGPSGPVPQAPAPAPAPAPATEGPGGPTPGAEAPGAAEPAAPTKAVAKKAVAKKAVVKKAVAKKAVVRKPPATITPAQDEAEPARPVKKAPPRKQQPGGAE